MSDAPAPSRYQNLVGRVVHEAGTGRLRGHTRCGLPIRETWIRLTADRAPEDPIYCSECWPQGPPPTP